MIVYLFPIAAVVLGVFFVLIRPSSVKSPKLLLAFSGAFLLSITVFDLLPDVYESLASKTTGLLIMLGIFTQIFLEFFSKGAEHGHMHIHKNASVFPWLLFVSLCFHAFLEGFPINQDNSMVYGVLIHKIPIAVLLTTFLIRSDFKNIQIVLFLVIFVLMTPLGTFMANSVAILLDYVIYINALVIGIFLHVSTTILFESSEGHRFNLVKLLTVILGIGLAYML